MSKQTPVPYHFTATKYPAGNFTFWEISQWVPNENGTLELHHVGCDQFSSKEKAQAQVDLLNIRQLQNEILDAIKAKYFAIKDDNKAFILYLKDIIAKCRKNHKRIPWEELGKTLRLQAKTVVDIDLAKMVLD